MYLSCRPPCHGSSDKTGRAKQNRADTNGRLQITGGCLKAQIGFGPKRRSASVPLNAAYFLSKGVLGAQPSRRPSLPETAFCYLHRLALIETPIFGRLLPARRRRSQDALLPRVNKYAALGETPVLPALLGAILNTRFRDDLKRGINHERC